MPGRTGRAVASLRTDERVAVSVAREVLASGRRTAGYATRATLRPVRRNRSLPDIPSRFVSPWLLASVYSENLLMSALPGVMAPHDELRFAAIRDEVDVTVAELDGHGWLDHPDRFHRAPPPIRDAHVEPKRIRTLRYEHLSFTSGYRPAVGRDEGELRWDALPNRTAHAYVLRHDDGPRPWLVILHGYAAGHPLDFSFMGGPHWHRDLGFNVIAPVAPYHQQRRVLARSGMGMTSHDYVRNLHAYGQAVWDVRRCIGWAAAQGMTSCSLYGVSMGGYLAGLVSGVESAVDTVVAGIPAVDMAAAIRRRCPPAQLTELKRHGLLEDRLERVHTPVRPLEFQPLVPVKRRFVYAGVADQITGARDAHALWQHWGRPEVLWHNGTHITTTLSRRARSFVDEALAAHAVTGPPPRRTAR